MSFDYRSIVCLVELTIPITHALSFTDVNKHPSDLAKEQQEAAIYTTSSAVTQHVLDGQMEATSIHQQTGLLF